MRQAWSAVADDEWIGFVGEVPIVPRCLPVKPSAGAGETVLIVDDDPSVRMLVSEVLAELGYKAIESSEGASVLQILRSDARIDLLVTDVGLPGANLQISEEPCDRS